MINGDKAKVPGGRTENRSHLVAGYGQASSES